MFGECLLYLLWLLPNSRAKSLDLSAYLRTEEEVSEFIGSVMKEAWGERWPAMWDRVSAYETGGFEKAQIRLADRLAEVLVGHEIKSIIWLANVTTHVNLFCLNVVPVALKYTFGEELFDAPGFQELQAFVEQKEVEREKRTADLTEAAQKHMGRIVICEHCRNSVKPIARWHRAAMPRLVLSCPNCPTAFLNIIEWSDSAVEGLWCVEVEGAGKLYRRWSPRRTLEWIPEHDSGSETA